MSFGSAFVCALVYSLLTFIDTDCLSWQCLTRPIVVAPIVGGLLGDLHTGIIMGASLEAIFMGISAVGGSVPSDALSGTILAVAYAVTVGGADAIETGFALSLTLGTIMSTISSMLMAVWGAMTAYWEKLASECNPVKFKAIALTVAFLATLPGALIIFLGCRYGVDSLAAFISAAPAWVITGLATAGSMMTAVGFGILLSMIWSADICVFYFVGFIMAKSLGLSSLGIAVIGAAVALTVFFLEKNIVDDKKSAGTAASTNEVTSEEDFF
ncbi:MAG: PTS sugar transporter subunit IIC [Erysipelotrichaceae bacterium]|nr:PTS sugar transporter subunit IIC [Erysipelotrichaceae bacterium]